MPFGLRPVGRVDGTPYMADQERLPIAPTYTTAIFHNDPVKLSSGTLIRGVAGQSIYGILQGVQYTDPSGNLVFDDWWPGIANCTNIRAVVVNSPDIVLEAETAAAAGNIAQTYVGALVDFALGTGNTITGLSAATVGAAGGAGFKVLRVPDSPGNELGSPSRRVHVTPVLHELRP
jgi:hypothetical protein